MSFARSFADDPKSRSFDLTRIPTLSKMVLTDFYAKEDPDMINEILAWLIRLCGENMSISSISSSGLYGFSLLLPAKMCHIGWQ